MKKYVKIGIVLTIILSLIIPFTIVNATTENETEDVEFLTATSEQITLSDKIELVVNIENISYTNFTLTLTSEDLDFSSLKISSNDDEEDDGESNELGEVETTEDENTLVITISNSTLKQTVIQIDLPDGAAVGDVYEIVGTVANSDNKEDKTLENTVEIEVVESSDTSDSKSTDNFQDSQTENSSFDNISMSNETSDFSGFSSQDSESYSSMNNASNDESSLLTTSETISLENSITYNGSSNNYLSELSIDGYNLNKTFSKESQTYFATVGSDVDSLTINATAEDDGATVHIYGNTDLQTGENKILISVYAENGNERVYKIIVTKEA